MQKTKLLFFLVALIVGYHNLTQAQTLADSRRVEWHLAGYRGQLPNFNTTVNINTFGALGDGLAVNDTCIQQAIAALGGNPGIIEIPAGNFLFNNTINLPSNTILKGAGAENTVLTMDLGGSGHSITINGSLGSATDTTSFTQDQSKGDSLIMVMDAANYAVGDWCKIFQNDSSFVDWSQWSWGLNNVGQLVQIKAISGNQITLSSPLRMDYPISRTPYLHKLNMAENVGIECLKIHRLDNTAPQQSSNILFDYACNSWVSGIETHLCTFSHLQMRNSSNIYVNRSYFHHAHEYGGGGRAYGVMLQATSGECLIENNIFQHLRHSMITQQGANGNVFAYNYSFEAYWDGGFLNDSLAGDAVFHGTYTYANLFEGNLLRNIVVDNSHASNGPYGTFLRNRADYAGIFNDATTPSQNYLGNEITFTGSGLGLGLYLLLGTDHFEYGNNHQGTIKPSGTTALADVSYTYDSKPDFLRPAHFGKIGTPNTINSGTIPAYERYITGNIFRNACGNLTLPEVQFDSSSITVNEGDGTITIYIQIDYTNQFLSTSEVAPVLVASPQIGEVGSDDFVANALNPININFPPNDDSPLAITFDIVDDTLVEGTEILSIDLSALSNCSLGSNSTLTLYIEDNDLTSPVSQLLEKDYTIEIFPNPSQHVFNLSSSCPLQKIEVWDLMGRLVYEYESDKIMQHQLPSHNWWSGSYYIRTLSLDNKWKQQILLKK
ncbi:MAG: hypothetical protein MK212_14600 [Saprospiraceae bacterium]|nr:hypothetical protein [Saprospiraceae bacterium]